VRCGAHWRREPACSRRAAALLALVLGGAIIYFAAAQLTGAADLRQLARNMRRARAGATEG